MKFYVDFIISFPQFFVPCYIHFGEDVASLIQKKVGPRMCHP